MNLDFRKKSLRITRRSGAVIVAAVMLAQAGQTPPFSRMQDQLNAAHESATPNIRRKAYAGLAFPVPATESDVQALVDELNHFAIESLSADNARNQELAEESEKIGDTLSTATDPALQAVIARLLDQEAQLLPANSGGPDAARTPRELAATMAQYEKVQGLARAAGGGKNTAALSALRAMTEKGGIALAVASSALGEIGDPADLDHLIQIIKLTPQARVDLSSFGSSVIDRIMLEVNNPSVPDDQKNRLIGFIASVRGRDMIPKYQPLLRSSNLVVVRTAARGLAQSMSSQDQPLLLQLLEDNHPEVRIQMINLLQSSRFWNDQDIPAVRERLLKDTDEVIRAVAASLLGSHHVSVAAGDLKQATQDSSQMVRRSAQAALKKLGSS